jgi:predicted ATPase
MSAAEEECDALARRLHFVKRAGQDELPNGTTSTFYVFTHGLYREVLYQRQSATRRARGHSRIAERLSELFRGREADVAREIAMHHEAAGNWLRAIESLRAAAQGARARDAHGMAEEIMLQVRRISERLTEVERESAVQEVLASQPAAIAGFDGRNGQARKVPQKFDNF